MRAEGSHLSTQRASNRIGSLRRSGGQRGLSEQELRQAALPRQGRRRARPTHLADVCGAGDSGRGMA